MSERNKRMVSTLKLFSYISYIPRFMSLVDPMASSDSEFWNKRYFISFLGWGMCPLRGSFTLQLSARQTNACIICASSRIRVGLSVPAVHFVLLDLYILLQDMIWKCIEFKYLEADITNASELHNLIKNKKKLKNCLLLSGSAILQNTKNNFVR
jgi:hypothetical protein